MGLVNRRKMDAEAIRLEEENAYYMNSIKAQEASMFKWENEIDFVSQKFHGCMEELNELRRVGGPAQDIEQIEKTYTENLKELFELKQYLYDTKWKQNCRLKEQLNTS